MTSHEMRAEEMTKTMRLRLRGLPLLLAAFFALPLTLTACSSGGGGEEGDPAVAVEASTVLTGDVDETIRLTGSLLAGRSVRVFGQVPDRITRMLVDTGDRVTQGQVLARIRDDALQANVEQVEANLRAARSGLANLDEQLSRTRRLFESGATSQQALDGVQTQRDAAQAQVEQLEAARTQARSVLQNAAITAPFAGVIANRFAQAGDMVGPGIPVFELVDMGQVRARADISQEQIGRVRLGMPVRLSVPSEPGRVFEGNVTQLSPVLNPASRMGGMEAEVGNADGLLRAGMFVNVDIVVDSATGALLVPIQALLDEYRYMSGEASAPDGSGSAGTGAHLYVIDGDRARLREVRVGLVGRYSVQVLSGLAAGDRVVTVGKHLISDGAALRITHLDGELLTGGGGQ